MSVTKYIACKKCKVHLWIGQNNVFYSGEPKVMVAMERFMVDHESSCYEDHPLEIISEHTLFDGEYYNDFKEIDTDTAAME